MPTVKQASKKLNVNKSRILQFIYTKRLIANRCECGHGWLISEKELDRFAKIERKTGKPRKNENK